MKPRIICPVCGLEIMYRSRDWRCPSCFSPLKIELDPSKVKFRREGLSTRPPTMWRYRELIPITTEKIVSLGEGYTKILEVKLIGKVYLKLEYLSPSGSFKDRGSSTVITHAREVNVNTVVEDSSGNAGSSIALYSSAAGLKSRIYIPKDAPENKKNLIKVFGGEIVEALSRGEASELAVSSLRKDEYYVGHLWNPFYIEGVKTVAFECAEQLDWSAPDYVIVPVASGTLLLGFYSGFRDLIELGLIRDIPVLIGVQAEGCAPVYESLIGKKIKWRRRSVLADALRVTNPPRLMEIVKVLKRTHGKVVVVNDDEIAESLKIVLKKGFFIEPSSATPVAAYKRLLEEGYFKEGEKILIPLTGSGFKALDKLRLLKLV